MRHVPSPARLTTATLVALALGGSGCELFAFADRHQIDGGASGTGGSGGGGTSSSGGGSGVACVQAADCPGAGDCVLATCQEGRCGTSFAAAGTPTPTQVSGDCQRSVCDGKGAAHLVADDGDLPTSGNPCTDAACTAGVPSSPARAAGTPCSAGLGTVCDGNGSCVQCVTSAQCAAGLACLAGTCSTCSDGMKDGSETDVDCGGPVCGPCGAGKHCGAAADCASAVCSQGKCGLPLTCSDGTKDGSESGVDCGGPVCNPCGPGQPCNVSSDCAPPDTCGGGSASGVCGCTPLSNPCNGLACGAVADGCGGMVSCPGTCASPFTCGGAGKPNVCGCPLPGGCLLQTVFARSFGGPTDDDGFAVAVSPTAIFLGGSFVSQIDFGGGPLMTNGLDDAYLTRLDLMGGYVWAKHYGDAQPQFLKSVSVDGAGDLVVSGFNAGVIDFGGGPLTSVGPFNVFVAKLDPGGGYIWGKTFGSNANQQTRGQLVDAAGNVHVVGFYGGAIDFGGGPLPDAGSGAGLNVFVAKLDPTGAHLWSHGFGGTATSHLGNGVGADTAGNVAVVASSPGTIDFGGGLLTAAGGAANPNPDVAVASFTAAGALRWGKLFGDAGIQKGLAVAVDPGGDVIVTGYFAGTIDFGGGALTATGVNDVFVARLDATGNQVWSRRAGGDGDDAANAVIVAPSGNIVLTGSFTGTLDCGAVPIKAGGTAPATDVFVLEYSPTGTCLQARRYGDTSPTDAHTGRALAADAVGNVYVYGDFAGKLDVGLGAPLVSNGMLDTFLIELTP